jgi:hypothetical protein
VKALKHLEVKNKGMCNSTRSYAIMTCHGHGASFVTVVTLPYIHRAVCFVCLTFRHRASSIKDRRFVTLQRMLFIYLINKYISFSDIS